MSKRRISGLKILLLIYLINQLIVGIVSLNINNQFYDQFRQKLLVKGEIIEMDYYNKTFPEVNFNILDDFNLNRTEHFYNLTVRNYLTDSIIYCSLEVGIMERFNVQIGNIIFIYKNPPFIVIKEGE